MSIGASIESAISGLFSGVEKAKQSTSELSKISSKVADATDSSSRPAAASGSEDGKGANIDVTA